MKKQYLLSGILLIIIFLVVASISGIPITKTITDSGCNASFSKYYFPKTLCQIITNGHCSTSEINEYNAKVEIAHCLCDQYKNNQTAELENKILRYCSFTERCDYHLEDIYYRFCNMNGLNSQECPNAYPGNKLKKVELICENKDVVIPHSFIF